MPIAFDATLRHYRGGHAGLVAEALEQPLLLPQDMAAYRTFNHPELFLSLKRDLAMVSDSIHQSLFIHPYFLTFYSKSDVHFFYQVTQQVFVAKEWIKNTRNETRVALDARDAAQSQLNALKEKQAQMAEQVKDALRQRNSAKAGLKTTEKAG